MPDANDRLPEDLAGGATELIPGVGPLLAPLTKRALKSVREEWARNNSKALRAAERISGMSREELSDRISDDPRLIPLVTRVLYASGMTGQDTILRALGTALGDAVQNPEKVDEAELLLIGISDLRRHHVVILEAIARERPKSEMSGSTTYWTARLLANAIDYSPGLVTICIAGLVRSGSSIQSRMSMVRLIKSVT